MATSGTLATAIAVAAVLFFSVQTAFAATINVPVDQPTIQAAIAAASPGDTIQVAAGTYSEPIQTLAACGFEPASYCIDKPLTLRGDPGGAAAGPAVGAPVLDGTGLGDGSAIVLLRTGAISSVTIEGFVIRDYTNPVGQGGVGSGVMAWNTQASDVMVNDNTFEDLGWNGVLVGSDTDTVQSGWSVLNNIVDNAAYAGVELTNVTDSTVADNEITVSNGNWDAGDSGVGIEVAVRDRSAGSTTAGTDVVVSGNMITGGGAGARAGVNLLARAYNLAGTGANLSGVTVSDNDVSGVTPRGIYAVAETRNAAAVASIDDLTITDNIISGNGDGVVVSDFVNGGGTPSHSDLSINRNSITGNAAFGMEVENGNLVDGTCNWWGNVSGPSGVGPGTGDAVSANVDFEPWLTTSDLDGPCDGPLPPPTPRTINSSSITINVMNRGSVVNVTQSSSHTGANIALGSTGGAGGAGGSVTAGAGNENNGGASAGNGGSGGNASEGGLVQTGNASADAGSLNDVNTTDAEVDLGCDCPGDINGLTIDATVDNDGDDNVITNLTRARARSGANVALGSDGGNAGNGGNVSAGAGNENNGGASAGTGGAGGSGDVAGTIVTGNANSTSGAINLLNNTFVRIRF
ncbi:hypothetical protein A2763_00445 [Candidatus Kaiserbacteria bacterium RIFCSPHIGHO2_01_FULL_54_36]|uniref:Uncharacterized protein n=1 Tax=Candidatus Kaiserbacteria bacterium RIFCSPHIGHO2_01_FULL_54_36 TaxID=1798482 RepID=A0A1F6CND3_9BACT|nr:MAG: hypothetical protein A2763_00445 [Candidatus Kaiserbacteria bacterium RIFCSPHIGHO2_01_FULL_54_36]OGG75289.1 MAG: hypothetical protein A3A41_03270 [Candidatus Kaiserbacteria bacterium RIFCSPLOWO2_01_FULL_54_22]